MCKDKDGDIVVHWRVVERVTRIVEDPEKLVKGFGGNLLESNRVVTRSQLNRAWRCWESEFSSEVSTLPLEEVPVNFVLNIANLRKRRSDYISSVSNR